MRSRNIKPSLFSNEVLGSSDPYLTILFAGLWCLADREGRLEDRPLKIKATVFPYRNFTESKTSSMLDALGRAGLIRRYEVDGRRLIQVVKFLEHQSPHSTEKESQLPPEPLYNQHDTSLTLGHESITQIPPNSGISGIRESENQESGKTLSSSFEIFSYWQMVHDKPRAQFTIERKRRVKERLADSTVDEIRRAIDGCRASPFHQGQNDRGMVYDDLELICRSRTQLEKFIGVLEGRKHGQNTNTSGNRTGSQRGTDKRDTQSVLESIGVFPN